MAERTNLASWWHLGPSLPLTVKYGNPPKSQVELAFPERHRAAFKYQKEHAVGQFNPCRADSPLKQARKVQAAVAFLPKGGAWGTDLYEADKHIPELAGFVAADAYELATWIRNQKRIARSSDILFAPRTFSRTLRGSTSVLCYSKRNRNCVFYNVTKLTNSEYDAAHIGSEDWLIKHGMTMGVLYTKPI